MYGADSRKLDRLQSRSGRQHARHHLPRRQSPEYQGKSAQRSPQIAIQQEGHSYRPHLRPAGEIAGRDVSQLRGERLDAQAAHPRQNGRHDQSPRQGMTTEFRIGRTLAIPFAILAIFLIANPRTCKRTLVHNNAVVTTSSASEPSAGGGLIINSNVSPPHRQAVVHYPEGLDAARVQYLVEINPQFAAP